MTLELAVAQLEAELPDDAKLALQRVHAGQWRAAIYLWRMDGDDVHVPRPPTASPPLCRHSGGRSAKRDRRPRELPVGQLEVRRVVELLDNADQRRAYIKLVRAQFRSDAREVWHMIGESDLGVDPAAVADGRLARSTAGAGGGRRRGGTNEPE